MNYHVPYELIATLHRERLEAHEIAARLRRAGWQRASKRKLLTKHLSTALMRCRP